MSERNIFNIGPPLAKALAGLATQLQEFLDDLENADLVNILVAEIKRVTEERDEARAERSEARVALAQLIEEAGGDVDDAASAEIAIGKYRLVSRLSDLATMKRQRDEAIVEREQMRDALAHAYQERDIAQQTLRQVLGPDDEPAPWVDVMCCDCGVSDDVPLYPQNGTVDDATKWRCAKCCEALENANDRMRCKACARFITEDQVRKVGVVLDGVMREMTPHCVHCLPKVKLR